MKVLYEERQLLIFSYRDGQERLLACDLAWRGESAMNSQDYIFW